MNGLKANARIRVTQEADLVLKNLKFKIFGQPHDDMLLTTDKQFKHYKAIEDPIILKDGLLFPKYYGETRSVKYHQLLKGKQLDSEVLRNLHGEYGKHPGITRTKMACREKDYDPNMAQLTRELVISCEQCIKKSRINRRRTHAPLRNPHEYITVPEDAIQIDLVPE